MKYFPTALHSRVSIKCSQNTTELVTVPQPVLNDGFFLKGKDSFNILFYTLYFMPYIHTVYKIYFIFC